LDYLATKLYLALEFEPVAFVAPAGTPGLITLYNAADLDFFYVSNNSLNDATIPDAFINNYCAHNLYFSRMAPAGYNQIRFIGYRLTLP
jgi:hypothetical protein